MAKRDLYVLLCSLSKLSVSVTDLPSIPTRSAAKFPHCDDFTHQPMFIQAYEHRLRDFTHIVMHNRKFSCSSHPVVTICYGV